MIIIERPTNGAPWRFSLRTLFVIVAVVAALLFMMKWY
jgi:hypothetical protein